MDTHALQQKISEYSYFIGKVTCGQPCMYKCTHMQVFTSGLYSKRVNAFTFAVGLQKIKPTSMAFISLHFPVIQCHVHFHTGQRYDKDGILRPWWTEESINAFKERQQCFAEQYSKYQMFGFNVSDLFTMCEILSMFSRHHGL